MVSFYPYAPISLQLWYQVLLKITMNAQFLSPFEHPYDKNYDPSRIFVPLSLYFTSRYLQNRRYGVFQLWQLAILAIGYVDGSRSIWCLPSVLMLVEQPYAEQTDDSGRYLCLSVHTEDHSNDSSVCRFPSFFIKNSLGTDIKKYRKVSLIMVCNWVLCTKMKSISPSWMATSRGILCWRIWWNGIVSVIVTIWACCWRTKRSTFTCSRSARPSYRRNELYDESLAIHWM